ncbi:MAG: fibronectin type III domain-containing protein, partial [Elusimicrobia bacterium]|nr:fibronectin type III domain-containing protein [Elusimicrobiota bacterium]
NSPRGVFSDGTKLYVADTGNNRVLIWNTIPTANDSASEVVVGQPDTVTTTANTTQGGLNGPTGVWVSGEKLFVADRDNHRVLIYNTVPTAHGALADNVVGQPNFTSGSANQGDAVAANTLNTPTSVSVSGTQLFVADRSNHRVLIYDPIPTSDNANASIAVGQANKTSGSANQGGAAAANTLNGPRGVFSDGTYLVIADESNNRVLIYNAVPTADNASANVVFGQADVSSTGRGTAADRLGLPCSVVIAASQLLVLDSDNHRGLIKTAIPTSHGASANYAVGKTNLTTQAYDNNPPQANRLAMGVGGGVFSTGTTLFVADYVNYRALRFNTIPTANDPNADVAISDVSNLTSVGSGVAAQNALTSPIGLWVTGTTLLIADSGQHRIMIWTSLPTTHGAAASRVLGQANFTSGAANRGLSPGANTLNSPQGVTVSADGTKVAVADYTNNRVLIWNTFPTTNGQAADVVVGQANFTLNAANRGGSTARNTLNTPVGVTITPANKLVIADSSNNRVLVYNAIPTTNGTDADVVICQADFTSNLAGASATACNNPQTVAVAPNGQFFIADYGNNRVLFYSSLPTTNGAAATGVLGQSDFTSFNPNGNIRGGAPTAATLWLPVSVQADSSYLYVGDDGNNRVLLYKLVPAVPTTLAATSVTATSVNVSWSSNSNTGEVTYGVERAAGTCGGSPSFTEVTNASSRPTATTYTDSGLSAGTNYCYRVRAFAGHGGASGYTASVSTQTTVGTPSGLTVTDVSATAVSLSWTAGTSGSTYGVERAAGSCSGTFTEVTDSSNRSSDTTYTSSSLTPNTTYCFRVRAFNSAGVATSYSSTASKTTLAAKPTSLTVTSSNKDGKATLSWSANSNPSGTTYIVSRAPALTETTCGTYATAKEGLTDTTYTDAPTPDAYYCYQVSAKNADGVASSAVTALYNFVQPKSSAAPPAAMPELRLEVLNATTLKVSWPDYKAVRTDGTSFTLGGFEACLVTDCGTDFSAFATADYTRYCESKSTATTSHTVDTSRLASTVKCLVVLAKDKIDKRSTGAGAAVDLTTRTSGDLEAGLLRTYVADDQASLWSIPVPGMKTLREQVKAATGLDENAITISVKEVTVSETAKKTLNVVKEVKVEVAKITSGTAKEELNVIPQLTSPFTMTFQYEIVSSLSRPLEAAAPGQRRPALVREVVAKAGETKNLGVFYKAGDTWIPLGGKVDSVNKKVTLETARFGNFQLREVLRGTEFKLTRVFPRVITPNGDGWNDVVVFQVENPAADTVTGEIFDMSGAKVADLSKVSNEENAFQWDGKDSGGRVVPMGVYLYQIKGGSNRFSGTVVVAR